jgi:hypothetical protein
MKIHSKMKTCSQKRKSKVERRKEESGLGSAGNNTQCCPSVNQIPVMGQFVSQENESGICREMHGCGGGVCWCCRRTGKGSAAF